MILENFPNAQNLEKECIELVLEYELCYKTESQN